MKNNILFLILTTTLIFSCKQGDDTKGNSGDNNLEEHIQIDEIVNYLPPNLLEDSKVIYKNMLGEEKELSTYYTMNIKSREEFGRAYSHEMFVVRLFDESDARFSLEMFGVGLYSSEGDIQKSLDVYLMPGNPLGTCALSIIFNNGEPTHHNLPIINSEYKYFQESVTLNQKEFVNVYYSKNAALINGEPYSEIMVNSAVGVVAFKGNSNEWWVFDRFVE